MSIRRLFTVSLNILASGLLTCGASLADPPEHPNLIFILTDDQGAESISAKDSQGQEIFGNEMGCETPAMQRMADVGVSFRNCRVNPNCSPTRAALLTGRRALSTGVTGVLAHFNSDGLGGINPCITHDPFDLDLAQALDSTALQSYEWTVAEMLQEAGYYTILVDKWHVGADEVEHLGYENRESRPQYQGFDESYLWLDPNSGIFLCSDLPDETGDEHMVDAAVKAAQTAGQADVPYALFFHTITPHRRHRDHTSEGRRMWWELDDDLLVETKDSEGYTNSNEDRFKQHVEAIGNVIVHQLLEDLGVIDNGGPAGFEYMTQSDTVVLLLGDNGTDTNVSAYSAAFEDNHAKNSPYEGGVRVPLIIFGEGISDDIQYAGSVDDRLISQLDFYDTIADIAGIDSESRGPTDGSPELARDSVSFADSIGFDVLDPKPAREYTLNFLGLEEPSQARVSFVREIDQSTQYKLIARGGDADLAPMSEDEFYELRTDPHEFDNLLEVGMSADEINRYYDMRDLLVDHWPIAVSDSFAPIVIPDYMAELFYKTEQEMIYVLVVYVAGGELSGTENDEFYNLTADPDREENLLEPPNELTPLEEQIYLGLRTHAQNKHTKGELHAASDVRFVDILLNASAIASSSSGVPGGMELKVGHEDVGAGTEVEYRSFLKFEIDGIDDMLPRDFTVSDVVRVQIIVFFHHDSIEFDGNEQSFWDHDAPTGTIRIHPVTESWSQAGGVGGLFDDINLNVELGAVDLPPHIVLAEGLVIGENTKFRETPMPLDTPVSFGHNDELMSLFMDWYYGDGPNFGVALVADKLTIPAPQPDEDQHVHFQRDAILRLTLDRR